MRRRLLASSAIALGLLAGAAAARAETLSEALVETYYNNPQILAERALLRATDETVPQALSGWRPVVNFTGSVGFQHNDTTAPATPPPFGPGGTTEQTTQLHPNVVDLNITQPVYQGGRTVALTSQAENSVRAERARNLATEGTVFFAVVQSYLDVIRDEAVRELNINNEQVLRRQLEATQDRFRVGEITRTDVAQAESRLASATAARATSEGNLAVSRANYARAVGHLPGTLSPPNLRPVLPTTREEAIAIASTKNQSVVAALYTEDAARDAVNASQAQLMPSLNIVGDVTRLHEQQFRQTDTTAGSVIARMTVPLYEGGAIYSQTRQAVETVAQRKGQTDDARRAAVQGATQAFETVQSARASIQSLQSTIRAAEIALEGVQQEAQVGSRTVLDVLNAEQELFTDRVNLVTAQHDLAVAEFNLANFVGRLTAVDLRLPVKLYDVQTHYNSVRDKWIGFGSKQ
jgi:outer membrane protein